nr:hypothetical protein [Streptomyces yunnanensis]
MDVVLDVGVEDLVGVELGAVSGHQVQLDALGIVGEPGSHGFAVVDGVLVGDHVDLAPAWRASRSRKTVNTFAVNFPVNTVDQREPQEAIADMMFTRNRRPLTLTIGSARPGPTTVLAGRCPSARSALVDPGHDGMLRLRVLGDGGILLLEPGGHLSCCWQ